MRDISGNHREKHRSTVQARPDVKFVPAREQVSKGCSEKFRAEKLVKKVQEGTNSTTNVPSESPLFFPTEPRNPRECADDGRSFS